MARPVRLGIPTVKDRIVQAALKMVIEPIFEVQFRAGSFGFRPGRGCKDALREVDRLLKEGYTHVVDADLKSYFDVVSYCPQGYQLCYPRLSVYPIPLFIMTNMRPSMVHSATT